MVYYILIDGKQTGPLSLQELLDFDITPSTPVWREDMPAWGVAADFAELQDALSATQASRRSFAGKEQEQSYYFAIINGEQTGPIAADALKASGVTAETMLWKEGMTDWAKAVEIPELAEIFVTPAPPPFRRAVNPSQGAWQNQQSGQPDNYGQPFNNRTTPTPHTNWMGWAICGTILNFLFAWGLFYPFIGLGLGIAGIVLANSANTHYSVGNDLKGSSANSSAKICTIISLVLGGSALLIVILAVLFFASLLGASASYFNLL